MSLIGINVVGANIMTRLSTQFNPAQDLQIQARIDRQGQSESYTLHVTILIENSIDGRVMRIMQERSHLEQIFDPPIASSDIAREPSIELLPEALSMTSNLSKKENKNRPVLSPVKHRNGIGFPNEGIEIQTHKLQDYWNANENSDHMDIESNDLPNELSSPVRSLLQSARWINDQGHMNQRTLVCAVNQSVRQAVQHP